MFMFLFKCNNMLVWICHDVSALGLNMLQSLDRYMLWFGMKCHIVFLDVC